MNIIVACKSFSANLQTTSNVSYWYFSFVIYI